MGHAGSPDLTVDSIWLEDASQPGQPISQVSSGQSFLIVATIKNIGQETASGYYVDVYYDNDYGRGGPDNILAGEVQTWYVGPLTAQDGTHTTKWVVDPDNQIAELDESNNLKEYTFTVGQQTTTTSTTNATTTVQITQLLTTTGTTNVTSYTTTTTTSYTGTTTSTGTVVVPTTVTVGPSATTVTLQTTQVLTTTGTTQVTSYTTTTVTSYTATTTSTGTVVVYTTATNSVHGAGVTASPLTYLGLLSLLALTVSRVMPLRKGKVSKITLVDKKEVFEQLKKCSRPNETSPRLNDRRARSVPVAALLVFAVLLSASSGVYAGASFFPQQSPNVTVTTTVYSTTTSWTTSTIWSTVTQVVQGVLTTATYTTSTSTVTVTASRVTSSTPTIVGTSVTITQVRAYRAASSSRVS